MNLVSLCGKDLLVRLLMYLYSCEKDEKAEFLFCTVGIFLDIYHFWGKLLCSSFCLDYFLLVFLLMF